MGSSSILNIPLCYTIDSGVGVNKISELVVQHRDSADGFGVFSKRFAPLAVLVGGFAWVVRAKVK